MNEPEASRVRWFWIALPFSPLAVLAWTLGTAWLLLRLTALGAEFRRVVPGEPGVDVSAAIVLAALGIAFLLALAWLRRSATVTAGHGLTGRRLVRRVGWAHRLALPLMAPAIAAMLVVAVPTALAATFQVPGVPVLLPGVDAQSSLHDRLMVLPFAVLPFFFLYLALRSPLLGIELAPDELTVHDLLRTRRFAREQIEGADAVSTRSATAGLGRLRIFGDGALVPSPTLGLEVRLVGLRSGVRVEIGAGSARAVEDAAATVREWVEERPRFDARDITGTGGARGAREDTPGRTPPGDGDRGVD